jgi:hypothetical protein
MPDDVLIQLILLMMSTGLLETCREAKYTVRLLSFRSDCAERILRAPSGGHPQKHVGASLDTLCA